MLPMRTFESSGGGLLPTRGTYFKDVPAGVLSAVLPDRIRSFEATGQHRIVEQQLILTQPRRALDRGVA